MRALVALALLAAALAGCAGEPEVSRVGKHVHGGFYECPDGTRLDPGRFPDHHQDGFDIASKCPEPGQPARIGIDAPAAGMVYQEIELRWDITPARDGHHAERTELRIGRAPDAAGEVVAKEGSSMVPRIYRATWIPLEPGTYYAQAWASVAGQEVTSPELAIMVAEVQPTGVMHDVRIAAAGPLASIDPTGLRIAPGDTVRWHNDDVLAARVVLDGPEPATLEVEAQSFVDVILHRLGAHPFSVVTPLYEGSGTVTVAL